MRASDLRREATPDEARNFCRRSSISGPPAGARAGTRPGLLRRLFLLRLERRLGGAGLLVRRGDRLLELLERRVALGALRLELGAEPLVAELLHDAGDGLALRLGG